MEIEKAIDNEYTETANLGRVEISEQIKPYIIELLKLRKEVEQYRKIGTIEYFVSLDKQFKPHAIDENCCKQRKCNKCDKYRKELEKYHKIGTLDECRTAMEKQTPKEPQRVYIKHGKHEWKKDENGEIDYFAWSSGYCNGVVCEVCGKTVCVHCHPDYEEMQDCKGEYFLCPNCGKKHYERSACCECGQILKWGD